MFQELIDNAISSGENYVKLPAGTFELDRGLVVGRKDFEFLESFVVEGALPGFGGIRGTRLIIPSDGFGINFQRCKGWRLNNIMIQGKNELWRYSDPYQVLFDENMDWINGVVDNATRPHAGITVDAFLEGVEPYPGFEDWARNPHRAGSTDGVISNISVRYFRDGIAVQPSGMNGNGDCIRIADSWVDYCKYGISTGNHQNRSIFIDNLKSWGVVHTLFNCRYTGSGTGCPMEVDGMDVAGSMRYLCSLTPFVNYNALTIARGHTEMLGSLGGCETPHGRLVINGSWINMVPGRDIIFTGSELIFNDSTVTYYGSPGGGPMKFDVRHLALNNSPMDTFPVLANKQVYGVIRTKGFNYGGQIVSDQETMEINVDSNDGGKPWVVAQNATAKVRSNYRATRNIKFTTQPGYYENGYLRHFLPNICAGKTVVGSKQITAVNLVDQWRWGQFTPGIQLISPAFEPGTIIEGTDFDRKIIFISKAAIKTGTYSINGVPYK